MAEGQAGYPKIQVVFDAARGARRPGRSENERRTAVVPRDQFCVT